MALFSVTRFTGEETCNDDQSKEEDLLTKLNRRALKRKSAEQFNAVDEDVKNKSKNKKEDSTSLNTVNQDFELKLLESPAKKKRKEKRASKAKSISEEQSTSSNKSIREHNKIADSANNILESHKDDEEGGNQLVDQYVDIEKDTDEKMDVTGSKEAFTIIGDVSRKKTQKVERVLPQWLSQPSVVQADIRHNTTPLSELPGIDNFLIKKLQENGIKSYFPVQAQVIPALLNGAYSGFTTGPAGYRPSDICCSAPTGSGKTLAYVLPIVQALKKRVTCEVRALVVLPVRDLAVQVCKVFQTYCAETPLKVATLIGTKSFSQEQNMLVKEGPRGYQSCVDIVIATPGRLVDHINSTSGFRLAQLRFLVIDEADRMMDEIKQDWLAQVEKFAFSQGRQTPGPLTAANMANTGMPLQKLLFSATLSQNPEKLQQLGLFQPRLFTSIVKKSGKKTSDVPKVTQDQDNDDSTKQEPMKGDFIGKYTTPVGLSESFIECSSSEKPLVVLYLLHHLKFKHVLCFTNSVEATHRLFWLIKLVGGLNIEEFSSRLHKNKRTKLIKKFESGKIDILICSDAMARGMDVENVQYVISYESPPFLKTYIHRVGRTARAGKVGTALTLLERKEVFHFKKMITEVGKNVKEMKVQKSDIKPYIKTLQGALEQLPRVLKAEKVSQQK